MNKIPDDVKEGHQKLDSVKVTKVLHFSKGFLQSKKFLKLQKNKIKFLFIKVFFVLIILIIIILIPTTSFIRKKTICLIV